MTLGTHVSSSSPEPIVLLWASFIFMKLDRAIAYPVKYINTSITADLRVLVGRAEHRGSLRQLAFIQRFLVWVVLDPRGPEDTNKIR